MAMAANTGDANGEIHEMTREEGLALFERHTRRYLNMSVQEFLRRYDAGEFDEEIDDRPELEDLEMMIPLGR